jgi:hypothetical protein
MLIAWCAVVTLACALAQVAGRPPSEVPLVPVPPPPLGLPHKVEKAEATAKQIPPQEPPPPLQDQVKTPRELLQAAQARIPELDSYIVRMCRREVINGKPMPEEVILFRFRARPWSVYFKWLGKEGKGREVLCVKGQHDDKIHSLLAAGDVPFLPAGKRMSLSPDNILVKTATRHPISEAGIHACIARIERLLAAIDARGKRAGEAKVLGPLQRPEFSRPVLALEHVIPPREDDTLPLGGKRTYFFDPDTGLPMLVIAEDEKGNEAEYYRSDRLMTGVKLDDADFDPEHLWGRTSAQARR